MGEIKKKDGVTCQICGVVSKEATWQDGYKAGKEVGHIEKRVRWDDESEAWELDDIIEELEDRYPGKEIFLLSMDDEEFTKADIKNMPIGIEDVGAICDQCKGSL